MSHALPKELKYTSSHEWVRQEGDAIYCIGITDHAQELLGDMVFVELPEVGSQVAAGDECAVAESVKAASDIYSPLTGQVIAVNDNLEGAPEQVNHSPYDEGWLFKIKADDETEWDELLLAKDYQATIEE